MGKNILEVFTRLSNLWCKFCTTENALSQFILLITLIPLTHFLRSRCKTNPGLVSPSLCCSWFILLVHSDLSPQCAGMCLEDIQARSGCYE